MSYPKIVCVLHEFELITTEQAEQALEEYDRERARVEQRAEDFRREWNKSASLRERFWGNWRIEFYKSEMSR